MASHFRWGALIHAALAAPVALTGCGPSMPAADRPSSTIAQPAALASSSAPAPSAPPGLTVSEARVLLDGSTRPAREASERVEVVRYGRGLFAYQSHARRERHRLVCALAGAEGCSRFAISSSGASPADRSWASGSAEGAPPLGPPRPAAHPWSSFAPGRDVVYALREAPRVIDRIDDQGSVGEAIVEAPDTEGWKLLQVIEGQDGPQIALFVRQTPDMTERDDAEMVAGRISDRTPTNDDFHFAELAVAEIEPPEPGEPPRADQKPRPARLGPLDPLGIARLRGSQVTDLRVLVARGVQPAWGSIGVSPIEGDRGAWALAWHEVVPPAYASPAGVVPRRKQRARHSCGAPFSSRHLGDKSVIKRLHITRMRGANVDSDDVVDEQVDVGVEPGVSLRSTAAGLEVNGVLYDPKGRRKGGKRATGAAPHPNVTWPVSRAEDERVVGGGFDRASGEGLVVVQRNDKLTGRRFDASGALRGGAVAIDEPAWPPGRSIAVKLGGEWAVCRLGARPRFVTGPLTGKEPPTDLGGMVDMIPDGNSGLLILTADRGRFDLHRMTADADGLHVGERLALVGDRGDSLRFASREPLLLASFAKGRLLPPTAWADDETPQRANLSALGSFVGDGLIEGWSSSALLLRGEKQSTITWARLEATATVAAELTAAWPNEGEEPWPRGPLLGDTHLLPSAPGQPIAVPSLEPVARRCPLAWATGPKRFVMACEEPLSTDTVGLSATLRGVTYEPG